MSFSFIEPENSHFTTYIYQILQFYSYLYYEGFNKGVCLYIMFLLLYNILFP